MGTFMSDASENPLSPPVPASNDEITPDWLQHVLSFIFPGVVVKGLAMEQIGQEYGLASQIYRCRWHGRGALHRVIIKLWSTDGPAGTREVHFYRTFGRQLGVRAPVCFHAALDSDNRRGVLLLEDLDSVTQGDDLQQLPLPQAMAVARTLAGIHATWLEHETLYHADWLPSVATWDRSPDWFAPRRALFLERFGDRLDNLARALLDKIEQAPAVTNERLAGAPLTLLHQDLHLDNFVFVEATEPVLLDWARCAKGPLALDLYELLFRMAQPLDYEQVLATYLHEFSLRAGKAPEPAIVWHQLGGAFLGKFSISTCGIANWQPSTAREVALIEVSLNRAFHNLRDWFERDPDLFSFL